MIYTPYVLYLMKMKKPTQRKPFEVLQPLGGGDLLRMQKSLIYGFPPDMQQKALLLYLV